MKNNEELQKDVRDAIKWEPLLDAAEIGVTVKDGVVTLTGIVDSYAKKMEAENTVKNVAGVKVVVEKIELKSYGTWGKKDDNEVADEILRAFKWNSLVPNDRVKVRVEKGWVTLEGDLEWSYQRDAANEIVKNLLGVTGVTNDIKLKANANDAAEEADIESALKRNWSIYDNDIHVKVSGHTATLTGIVDSGYQKDEAGRIAYKAPGIWFVDNELVVDYEYALMDV